MNDKPEQNECRQRLEAICRVSYVLRSPSPDPRRQPKKLLAMSLKFQIVALVVLVTCTTSVSAQENLTPEAGILAQRDSYEVKIADVFKSAYAQNVQCRAVLLPSFQLEEIIGIRKVKGGFEVFDMKPSSSIWDTELVGMYERGSISQLGKDGKPVPVTENDSYKDLKKRVPVSHRDIKVVTKSAKIDKILAVQIMKLWERMLISARHADSTAVGVDGATYHFSMWISGRGVLSGRVWSPNSNTKTANLVEVAISLSKFAEEQISGDELSKVVARATRAING